MDARKAADARRAKVLARGGDRLAKITGALPEAATVVDVQAAHAIAAAVPPAPSAAPPPPPSPPPAAVGAGSSATQQQPQAQQQRRVGTATNLKWAQYEAGSGGGAARPRFRQRKVTAAETLSAAVLGTSRLRLLLAALLAVLLAWRWDAAAAAMAQTGAGAAAAPPATGLQARWQAALRQARHAAGALAPLLGQPSKQPSEQNADEGGRLLLAMLAQQLRGALAAAAATPAGQQAGAALRALRSKVAEAAGTPAGQGAAIAAQRLYVQLAGAARALLAGLAAAKASPLGQQAAQALDRLPPLASVLLLDVALIAASALVLAAAPSLVHSTVQLELDLQTPGLLSRLAGLVPGLAQQLGLLAAWQRLLTSLLDDAAAFLAGLVVYHQLPALVAGWAEGGSAS